MVLLAALIRSGMVGLWQCRSWAVGVSLVPAWGGLGLLGKGLLVRQQGQGWGFRGEAGLIQVDCCSCKDTGTENSQMEPQTVFPCSVQVRPVFRGNIRQIRSQSKQRVCAIIGTQALGAQTCRYYFACLLNSYVIRVNSAKHDDLAITHFLFFFCFICMDMKKIK